MKLYNSLSKQIEEVEPIRSPHLGMYTCGPTVYNTATIANFRTYLLTDLLRRSLTYLSYEVTSVMNLTDVGHLTGDNEGDSSQGEDRLEKASKREGRSAWEIAAYYGNEFLEQLSWMNIEKPQVVCKATEHIPEQIEMIVKLERKGLVYRIADGIYFDTVAYERLGNTYGELSTLDEIKVGARLEPNPDKKNPRDFALWKFSLSTSSGHARRQMEWDSPWGVGFPGWHIECSAMSAKYLGEQFEIHVGGEDLRSTHHPNEIAQTEGASGKKPFVKYWVHGAFILVDGGRMGKSLGNAYTLRDLKERGYDPLALRYFYLTGHYRRQINFTWSALDSAQAALNKLRRTYAELVAKDEGVMAQDNLKVDGYRREFKDAVSEDMNMPAALAVTWEVVKGEIAASSKLRILREFDQVLGLELGKIELVVEADSTVTVLAKKRQELRKQKNYDEADKVRTQIEELGWEIVEGEDYSWQLVAKK